MGRSDQSRFNQQDVKNREAISEEAVDRPDLISAAIVGNDSGQPSRNRLLPVVGVGASAGGLEAFTQLLEALPADTGMAFVLVQHLDPKHKSNLTGLLAKATAMPVNEVVDGMKVEPDRVYVIPPNTNMAIIQGTLHLLPRAEGPGQHLPIDYFFRSLAEDQGSKAVGVILSGTASDGALGLKAIKAEGGVTFTQDEISAKYYGMPRAAIVAGAVDFTLSPEKIAEELVRIARHPYVNRSKIVIADEAIPQASDSLNKIFVILRAATGVDFNYYKPSTIKRRISRRMVLHRIDSLANYVKFLQANQAEVQDLFNDILINVTGFFRDPETYEALKTKVFPKVIKDRSPESPIRIWTPGCSTGEEAYSIAICLLEFLGDMVSGIPIQLFATDISEVALDKARLGKYPENIAAEVSPERLRRFFAKANGGYQISKTIRDMCVFAKQNVVQDPPFSRLDLISCRNLLIYLGPVLQKKVIPIFHYALKPTGFLTLGKSETIGGFSDLFTLLDKKNKIYARKSTAARLDIVFAAETLPAEQYGLGKRAGSEQQLEADVLKEVDRRLLAEYAPAGVLIDDGLNILQFRGHTGLYLEPAPGEASLNILKMAREGLLMELRATISEARKGNTPVRKEGLRVKANGGYRNVALHVIPIKTQSAKRYYLVLFEDVTPLAGVQIPETATHRDLTPKAKRAARDKVVEQLQQELASTRDYLNAIIAEQEETNAELRSANEEILSSNEELQSTNEELETAKEELQATNEELTTVNEELHNRNLELSTANNDFINLLAGLNMPIVMLGQDLRVRRFTALAEKVMNLIPTDIGRPLSDIKPDIEVHGLTEMISEVIDTVTTKECEVRDHEGRWYTMRIRPYKTTENKIDGAVLVLVDVDDKKRHEDVTRFEQVLRRESEARLKLMLDAANAGTWDWDLVTNNEKWSNEQYSIFGLEPGSADVTHDLWLKRVHPEDRERVTATMRTAIERKQEANIEYRIIRPDGGVCKVRSLGRVVPDETGRPMRMMGVVIPDGSKHESAPAPSG